MPIRVNRTTNLSDPQAPEYGGSVASVPVVGAAPAAFAGVAQDAAQLSARLYREDRDREIETKVSELDIQRTQADNAVLDRYRQNVGKQAVDQRADALAAVQQNAKQALAGIKDREVLATFKSINAARTQRAINDLDGHYRTEQRRYQVTTLQDRRDLFLDDFGRAALGDGYDPTTGQLAVEAQRARSGYQDEVKKLGRVEGLGQESIDLELRKADQRAFSGMAQQLLDQERYDDVRELLKHHGDRLDPQTTTKIQSILKKADVQQKSLDLSTKLLSEAQAKQPAFTKAEVDGKLVDTANRPDWNQTLADSLQALDEMRAKGLPAEVVDATRIRLEHQAEVGGQLQARAENKIVDQLQTWLERNQDKSYGDIEPGQQAWLAANGLEARMRRFAQSRSRSWQTTPQGLTALMRIEQSPELLTGTDLPKLINAHRGDLNDADLNDLKRLWHVANKLPVPAELDGSQFGSMIRLAAVDQTIIGGVTGNEPGQLTHLERYELAIKQRADQLAGPGGKVTKEIARKAIDEINLDRMVDATGKEVPAATLSAQELQNSWVVARGETEPKAAGVKVRFGNVTEQEQARMLRKVDLVNAARMFANSEDPKHAQPLLPRTFGSVAEIVAAETVATERTKANYERIVQRYVASLSPPFPEMPEPKTPEEEQALAEARARVRGAVPAKPPLINTGFGGIR